MAEGLQRPKEEHSLNRRGFYLRSPRRLRLCASRPSWHQTLPQPSDAVDKPNRSQLPRALPYCPIPDTIGVSPVILVRSTGVFAVNPAPLIRLLFLT